MATDKSFGCRFANTEKCADSCFKCELFHRDYISREAAISEILSEPTDAHYPSWYAEKLKQIPVADVRPVVRGTWEIADSYAGPGLINLRCSVCGAFGGTWKDNTIPSMLPKFCHECGADMRKVKSDEK